MLEVLERPAPYFSDPEKAKEARARQTELAQQTKQELENLRLILATKPIQPAKEPNRADLEASNQINLANELITHARTELNKITEDTYGFCEHCKRHGADAKEQAALLREIRGLMEHLCRLHNIAQAPTSKTSPTRQRASMPTVEPLNCGPTHTPNGGPAAS